MTAPDLFQQLHKRGVILTPYADGTLRCRAPQGILTHALVEEWSEHAAIAEYCGELLREAAEQLAWTCVLTSHTGCAACGYPDTAGAPR
jgi:hypothetical protein